MKKMMILMLASVFVVGSLALMGCDDDDDNGAASGPCAELAKAAQDCFDEVCDEFPDCSYCDPEEEGEGGEEATDEQCQEALDAWDHEACVDGLTMVCEMEEAAE